MKAVQLAALVALSTAQPAFAAYYEVLMKGTITEGYDQSGMFGAPGTDLAGMHFLVSAVFNTDLGTVNNAGYMIYGSTVPFVGATGSGIVQINREYMPVYSNTQYELAAPNAFSDSHVLMYQKDFANGVDTEAFVNLRISGLPPGPAITSLPNWSSDCQGLVVCDGGFFFSKDQLSDEGPHQNIYYNWGNFHGESFSAMVIGSPEPTTWVMMILGFGMVGAALRRRLQATA